MARHAASANGAAEGSVEYTVTVILQGALEKPRLNLTITSAGDRDLRSDQLDLVDGKTAEYERGDPTLAGTSVTLKTSLPASFEPGVIILNKYPEEDSADESPPLVASIELRSDDNSVTLYSVYSYIDLSQSDRYAFPSSKAFPGFSGKTPAGLAHFRGLELEQLRGSDKDSKKQRGGAERIYAYDVYNDLGNPKDADSDRPTLGGDDQKYPRRLRTGRAITGGGKEAQTEGPALPWIPIDEHFNSVKNNAFNGGAKTAAGQAAQSVLGTPRGLSLAFSLVPVIKLMFDKAPPNVFTNLSVVDALYDGLECEVKEDKDTFRRLLPVARLGTKDVVDTLHNFWARADDGLKTAFGTLAPQKDVDSMVGEQKENAQRDAKVDNVGDETSGGKLDDTIGLFNGLLIDKWPVPRIRENKALEWRSDEEFGRAALAGQNPFSIRRVEAGELDKFTVTDEDVKGLLGGFGSLKDCAAAKRLWILDFYDGYEKYLDDVAALKDSTRVQYAGRCLLFTRDDQVTVPVAIELQHTKKEKMRVFTPKDRAEVWLLAKTMISSLDSGIHQLISHWLRTHACVEPYIIATRRELSVLNPVYKLLKPHFRYTMRINCNARKALISAGGIVERGFTPGKFCMQLSSDVYAGWRFDEQALPKDLLKRGIIEQEGGELLLPNYSYAQDGLQLYAAIETFVGDYLRLYYDDDSSDRKVTQDEEIKAWWRSIREEGHCDISEGWPEIVDVNSLRDVLASIIWMTSCHHAAVNFGQYDNGGYFPYKPTKIIAKIPEENTKEMTALRNCFEKVFLNTISDPISALAIMITLKILSAHASDEEYLDRSTHSYIKEPEGVKVHQNFVAALKGVEEKILARNAEAEKSKSGQAYSLLIPSNPDRDPLPGGRPAGRGIPYSISI